MPSINEIALTMIVRDCAKELETCLKSAQEFFDHLFITDTGSQDDTIEVAKQFGAHISHYKSAPGWPHPFLDNFSKARNTALNSVPKNIRWISWLDSDDLLVNGAALRDLVINIKRTNIGIDLLYKNQEYHPTRTRVWPNGAISWIGRVHEEFITHEILDYFDFEGSHVYHNKSPDFVKDHQNRHIILLRLDIEDRQTIMNSYQLACYLLTTERWKERTDEALALLQYCSQQEDNTGNMINLKATYKISLTHARLGNYEDALQYSGIIIKEKKNLSKFAFYHNTLKIVERING